MSALPSIVESRLLSIYLNDHRAGASVGVAIARRCQASNRGNHYGEALKEIAEEIEADLETLEAVMDALDVRRNLAKVVAAWSGEKLGRLKLNGRLAEYSPLSRLLELELLLLGITGKIEMWEALDQELGSRLLKFDLPALVERGEGQRARVRALRLEAVAEAFADEAG